MTVYQNCSNHSALLNKMAARAKNRKTFKRLLLLNQMMDFEIIIQECFLGDPLPKLFKRLNKMAARAINGNLLLTTSSAKSVDRFWNNFTGMFLRWLSTKIAQTVPLRWTRWPPELKIEKPLNDFSSLTSASILKNYTGMFLRWLSTKSTQTVPLCWTKWPPGL